MKEYDKIYNLSIRYNFNHVFVEKGFNNFKDVRLIHHDGAKYKLLDIVKNKNNVANENIRYDKNDGNNLTIQQMFEKIKINFENSIDLIQQTKFSQETKKKLIDYLEMWVIMNVLVTGAGGGVGAGGRSGAATDHGGDAAH